jgi:hypothetical protein
LKFTNVYIALFLSIVALGCNKHKPEKNQEPLARVYDKYLYVSDIEGLINEKTSPEDSARIVSEYIDNWVRQNLILRVAEDNLQSALANINKQSEAYKESLIIYAYERQWLAENLDTVVVEDSIKSYFESNKKDFTLKSDIYKLAYAVTPAANKTADSIQFWFSRGIEKYQYPIERYCAANCDRFSINRQVWLNEDDLFQLLPYDMYAGGRFRTKGVVTHRDTVSRYFVKVEDFHMAGEIGPYDYLREGIKDIIINKRKMALLDKTYKDIYSEGLKRNNAEFIKKEE